MGVFDNKNGRGAGKNVWQHTNFQTGQTSQAGESAGNSAQTGQETGGNRGGRRASKKPQFSPRAIRIAVIAILVLCVLRGGFYNVAEGQNAVLTMFGNVVRTDTAGLYFKIPFLQRVHIVDMTTHGTGIGYIVSDSGQNLTNEDEGVMITSDFNFVDIDFYLEYKVNDPVAYLYNSERPEEVLKNMTLAAIRNTVSDYVVDDVITTGKSQIQAEVKERLLAELEIRQIGLQAVNLTIQDAEPPTQEIVQAFKSVETAKQGADTAVNNANKYRSEQIPAAEADADRITQAAEASKAARIAEAEGQQQRFLEMYDQYKNYPLITKQRLFYETMEDVLPSLKVIITDGNTQEMLPLESFSDASASTSSKKTATNSAVTTSENENEEDAQ